MTESLPPDVAEFVATKLTSGEFSSASEVTVAALRYYRDAEARELDQLQASIQVAREQLNRGEGIDLSDPPVRHAYFHTVLRESGFVVDGYFSAAMVPDSIEGRRLAK